METKTKSLTLAQEANRVEFKLNIDGVVEVPQNADAKKFFDGLLDKIIEYVEAQKGIAGLGMSYKEYQNDDEADDGKAT